MESATSTFRAYMALNTTAKMQKPASVTSHGSPSSVRSTAELANKATATTNINICMEVRSSGLDGMLLRECVSLRFEADAAVVFNFSFGWPRRRSGARKASWRGQCLLGQVEKNGSRAEPIESDGIEPPTSVNITS